MSGNLSGENFDANAKENQRVSLVPPGEYEAVAVGHEVRPTKDNRGRTINIQFQILKGPHQNRRVFKRFNFWNPSAEAQQIGRGEFSEFCRAAGIPTPKDTSELMGKPVRIKVKIKTGKDGYDDQNDISKFSARGASTPAQTVVTQHSADVPQSVDPPMTADAW